MNRRELLTGIAAASLLPRAVVTDRRAAEPKPPEQDQPIIVEGLFAGTIRQSHLKGMQQG